jgi:hypothetical protein
MWFECIDGGGLVFCTTTCERFQTQLKSFKYQLMSENILDTSEKATEEPEAGWASLMAAYAFDEENIDQAPVKPEIKPPKRSEATPDTAAEFNRFFRGSQPLNPISNHIFI